MKTKKIVHWSLFALIAAYIFTGLGITEYDIVGALTFGLIGRNAYVVIHDYLLVPFIIVLALHIILTIRKP